MCKLLRIKHALNQITSEANQLDDVTFALLLSRECITRSVLYKFDSFFKFVIDDLESAKFRNVQPCQIKQSLTIALTSTAYDETNTKLLLFCSNLTRALV